MAQILFATMPITGHVNPGLPIARQLVAEGHEVCWYTGKKFKDAIEATGSKHISASAKWDFNDSNMDTYFPERKNFRGLDQLKYDMKRIFTDHVPHSTCELQEILRTFPASVMVVDTAFASGPLLAQIGGPPCIAFGITAFPLASHEVAPFGLGLFPDYTDVGKVRNKLLIELTNRIIFKDVIDYRNEVRAKFNLEPDQDGVFDGVVKGCKLYLQGTVPEFEYKRSDMPENVRFIGPLLPQAAAEVSKPDWWQEMVDSKVPIVHVAQGTVATRIDELIMPTIYALADMDVLTIVSTKNLPYGSLSEMPKNVRLARFLPYSDLMHHVDAFVTNGGYGGVHYALAAGVPIVAAGTTEDKPEVANRIAWSGAGINLRTSSPSSAAIRRAVKQVLRNPSYKSAALKLSESIRNIDAAKEASRLILSIAAPVSS